MTTESNHSETRPAIFAVEVFENYGDARPVNSALLEIEKDEFRTICDRGGVLALIGVSGAASSHSRAEMRRCLQSDSDASGKLADTQPGSDA